jgi:hypothetical protein
MYDKLNNNDKEDFQRLANYLLSHTYMVRHEYQPSHQITQSNEDYLTVSRLFDLFHDYFELSGWRLEKDDNCGVISMTNCYEHNRLRLDRFTTLFLYVCRLVYEERRENAGIYKMVMSSTVEIVEKMRTYGLLEKGKTGKEVTIKERVEAQRTLSHFNIIRKMETSPWEGEGNNILILPSILSIVPNQGLDALYTEIESMKAEAVDVAAGADVVADTGAGL